MTSLQGHTTLDLHNTTRTLQNFLLEGALLPYCTFYMGAWGLLERKSSLHVARCKRSVRSSVPRKKGKYGMYVIRRVRTSMVIFYWVQ